MKKNIFFTSSLMIILSYFACENDDSIERTGKPIINIDQKSVTINEGEIAVFNLMFEYPINEKSFVRIDVLDSEGQIVPTAEPIGDPNSGNGFQPIILEDILVPYETWFDAGYFSYGYLGGSGYVAEIPAYTESFNLEINAILDAILDEPDETYIFRVSATSTMPAIINETISITIKNINACTWTLATFDAYGDGWNGGFITANVSGVLTDYAASGSGSSFEIGMVDGDNYSFTYTSGGGTGGAPGWEEENTYTLTAPDGTIWADGPTPNEGIITEGVNSCN